MEIHLISNRSFIMSVMSVNFIYLTGPNRWVKCDKLHLTSIQKYLEDSFANRFGQLLCLIVVYITDIRYLVTSFQKDIACKERREMFNYKNLFCRSSRRPMNFNHCLVYNAPYQCSYMWP